MTVDVAVARAVMRLARHCLGAGRDDWAAAMGAEFEVAARDGKPLAFATGCLFAAWREMATGEAGCRVLANYALAIGMLIPMAALLIGNGLGVSVPDTDLVANSLLADTAGGNPYLVVSQTSARPLVMLLWLSLAAAHVGLAWGLVDEDWPRIVRSGAAIGASTTTLAIVAGVMMLDLSAMIPQVVVLTIEYVAILLVAKRRARPVHMLSDTVDG